VNQRLLLLGGLAAALTCVALLAPALAGGPPATAARPAAGEARLIEFTAHPPRVALEHRFGYSQLLLTGRYDDGRVVDLTRDAVLESAPDAVEVTPQGRVLARADGAGVLRFRVDDQVLEIPVEVSHYAAPFEPSFIEDVMPLFSKIGCNNGTCHGSKDGKNGFKLSLRGYDPEFDHMALTDDLAGRRFNRVAPEQSLFLLKTTASVPHQGGRVLDPGAGDYAVLRDWIAGGAVADLGTPRVTGIALMPANPTLPLAGASQQFKVMATYADGRVRDVSAEAFVETADIEVLAVDEEGLATGLRRGEAAVLARYEGRYAATRVVVMGDRTGFEWPAGIEPYGKIDELVFAKLKRVRVAPSGLCTDAEFLRRVSLDLTGRPPTPQETRAFLMDRRDSRAKREEMVDRLIGSAGFVEYWTNKWSDLLQVNTKFLGKDGAERFRAWIQASVASNEPYDAFVAKLLDARGSTYENPPASYYKVLRQPDLLMENTTQLFLGVRFNCNKCHDHPFERWTQRNHWQLAAYFGRVGRKNAEGSPNMQNGGGNQPGEGPVAFEEIVYEMDEGEVVDPNIGQVAAPSFPYVLAGNPAPEGDRREQLVAWLTAPENPYFARSYVNRLWSYFLGVGLIDPVDDIRAGNPPSNRELLDHLTERFVTSDFDVRALLRAICTSRTYQQSIETNDWNRDDRINYSHALARRLPAEVIFDALHQATGAESHLPGVRAGTQAIELLDSSVKTSDGFLDLFGRPARESACECERNGGMSLGQALNLVNGPTVGDAVRAPGNRIADLVQYESDPARILEELYVAFLCRPPSAEETARLLPSLDPFVPENRFALDPQEEAALAEAFVAWEDGLSAPVWHPLTPRILESAGGATLTVLEDGSVLASGTAPDKDRYKVVAETQLQGITGVRLEALADPSLPAKGPGRADNGNFVLYELRVHAVPLADPTAGRVVAFGGATADFSQGGFEVAGAVDGDAATGWAVSPDLGRAHEAVFELAEDLTVEDGALLVFDLDQQYGGKHVLGRFRLSVTDSARPVRHHGLPEPVVLALQVPRAERDAAQRATIYRHYLGMRPEVVERIRLGTTQDVAWALANSPAFLFNR